MSTKLIVVLAVLEVKTSGETTVRDRGGKGGSASGESKNGYRVLELRDCSTDMGRGGNDEFVVRKTE